MQLLNKVTRGLSSSHLFLCVFTVPYVPGLGQPGPCGRGWERVHAAYWTPCISSASSTGRWLQRVLDTQFQQFRMFLWCHVTSLLTLNVRVARAEPPVRIDLKCRWTNLSYRLIFKDTAWSWMWVFFVSASRREDKLREMTAVASVIQSKRLYTRHLLVSSSSFWGRKSRRGRGHSQSGHWVMLAWPSWSALHRAHCPLPVGDGHQCRLCGLQPMGGPCGITERRRMRSGDQFPSSLLEGWSLPLPKVRDSGTGPCLTVTLSNLQWLCRPYAPSGPSLHCPGPGYSVAPRWISIIPAHTFPESPHSAPHTPNLSMLFSSCLESALHRGSLWSVR